MADANDVLGTSGKDAIPFEYQVEEQQLARKRALAQAMAMRGMQPVAEGQRFGRHVARVNPLNYLTQALQGYMGQQGVDKADQGSMDLAKRMGEAQRSDLAGVMAKMQGTPGVTTQQEGPPMEGQAGLPDIQMGAVPGDTRGAIAQAMTSRFPKVNAYGAGLQKTMQDQLMKQAEMLGGVDPVRGIERMQGGNPMAQVAPLAMPAVEFGNDPANNAYGVTRDPKTGKPNLTYAPKPTNVSLNSDVKTVGNANDDAAKFFNYGGKGYEAATGYTNQLAINSDLLRTLAQNPSGGAGADLFQSARKWAETVGAPVNEKTTPTEMASMQLGQRTLAKLGGLGAQVSDADRKFMLETQGNITNDPEALRRMVLIESKYLMDLVNKHNAGRQDVMSRMPPGLGLPEVNLSFFPGNGRDAEDLDRLFAKQGFGPRSGKPAAALPPMPQGFRKVP